MSPFNNVAGASTASGTIRGHHKKFYDRQENPVMDVEAYDLGRDNDGSLAKPDSLDKG
jgi:hypothetical protein